MTSETKWKIQKALTPYVGAVNDSITRESVLREVACILDGRFPEYEIICDETNNSPMRVQNRELHLTILKPAEFVKFNFTVIS